LNEVTLVSQGGQFKYRFYANSFVVTGENTRTGTSRSFYDRMRSTRYEGYRVLVSLSGQYRYYIFQNGWVLKEHTYTLDVELFLHIREAADISRKCLFKDKKWMKTSLNNPLSEAIEFIKPVVSLTLLKGTDNARQCFV